MVDACNDASSSVLNHGEQAGALPASHYGQKSVTVPTLSVSTYRLKVTTVEVDVHSLERNLNFGSLTTFFDLGWTVPQLFLLLQSCYVTGIPTVLPFSDCTL